MARSTLTQSAIDAAKPQVQGIERRDTLAPGLLCTIPPACRKVSMRQYSTNSCIDHHQAIERSKPQVFLPLLVVNPFGSMPSASAQQWGRSLSFSQLPQGAVLSERSGFNPISFSLAFASLALVMIIATRSIKIFVENYAISGCFVGGLFIISAGAIALATLYLDGAWLHQFCAAHVVNCRWDCLRRFSHRKCSTLDFGDAAGTGGAMYYCIQSLIVSGLGTLSILALNGSTAWPLVAYRLVRSVAGLTGYATLKQKWRGVMELRRLRRFWL